MRRRLSAVLTKGLLLLLVATTPLTFAADRQRIKDVGQKFMCVCGVCNQLLTECNHFGCAYSGPMLADISAEMDQGQSDQSIIAHFAEKYGITVLSAPPVAGFNITAWIMPFVALAAGGLLVIYFVRRYRAKWGAVPATDVDVARYRDKVEEELKKFMPED